MAVPLSTLGLIVPSAFGVNVIDSLFHTPSARLNVRAAPGTTLVPTGSCTNSVALGLPETLTSALKVYVSPALTANGRYAPSQTAVRE